VDGTHHPVEVAEAPGGEAEARDAEESVEDLAVDFEPDLAGRVVVVAAGVAHGGRGVEEEEEEHCAPGLGLLVRGGISGAGAYVRRC